MSELEKLLDEYNKVFGKDVPEGAIDEDTLIALIKKALKDQEPIEPSDDFVE